MLMMEGNHLTFSARWLPAVDICRFGASRLSSWAMPPLSSSIFLGSWLIGSGGRTAPALWCKLQ